MRRFLQLLTRPAGTHRRTPEAWAAMELALDEQTVRLDKADQLIARLVQQRDAEQARADGLQIENDALRIAYDELFARYNEATAISVPAPMDDEPTIRLPKYDPEATQDLTMPTWWNGSAVRTADVHSLTVIQQPQTAA